MTDRKAMQQALEALEDACGGRCNAEYNPCWQRNVADALRERLAQPDREFTPHEEGDDGWSDWVCPDPKSYLMKCCDCGLVHEAQFAVVRYKSETEREDCEPVDDPNLQAVFRMRRSEQWSPKDTAYRPGGLAQPEQEPVAFEEWLSKQHGDPEEIGFLQALRIAYISGQDSITTPPQRKPLPPQSPCEMTQAEGKMFKLGWLECEAAHGIKGEA